MGIFFIGSQIVFPISIAIKKSIENHNGVKKIDIKAFFENMFCVLFPWLLIVLIIILLVLFNKLFDNLFWASVCSVLVGLLVIKLFDR